MQIEHFSIEITYQDDGYHAKILDLNTGDTWISEPENGKSATSIVNFVERILYYAGEIYPRRGMSPERKAVLEALRAYAEDQGGGIRCI